MTLPPALRFRWITGSLAGALLWALGQAVAEAPDLDLHLELSAAQVRLSDGPRVLLEAPRPVGDLRLSLRFYQDGIRFQTGRQGLIQAHRQGSDAALPWDAASGAEQVLDRVPPGPRDYRLRVRSPEDLNLSLLDAAD